MTRRVSRKTAETYRHDDEALLRPDVGTQASFKKRKPPKTHRYGSSLSPALDSDGQSSERRRFTIANELGRWVCRYREGRRARFNCRPGDVAAAADRAAEGEANVFPAELLMPEPAVRVEFARVGSSSERVEWFGVSEAAMSWRLYNFGLVGARFV